MKKLIENIQLRWRLWYVCRKLGIKPHEFQRQYALYGHCRWPDGRRNGKSMAVQLWGLIRNVETLEGARSLAGRDPDSWRTAVMREVFAREYMVLLQIVKEG